MNIIATLFNISNQLSKSARLVQKHREETDQKEWALVSKSTPTRVLKWFGASKPSDDAVAKEERRVQFFKHQ